ncbi:MAG: hypothetical protein CO061_01460, partial [Candidatus Yonathbacteria bacterium CG_4_9_14_0_2_um_filter_47_74]
MHRDRVEINILAYGVATTIAIFVFFVVNAPCASAGYFDYDDVVVIVNDASATSTAIGTYFQVARS